MHNKNFNQANTFEARDAYGVNSMQSTIGNIKLCADSKLPVIAENELK